MNERGRFHKFFIGESSLARSREGTAQLVNEREHFNSNLSEDAISPIRNLSEQVSIVC